METRAQFTNIQKSIEDLISESKSSIKIVLAWFTNKELLGILTDKVKSGLKVEVIVSDDIGNKRLKPKDFIEAGGKYLIFQTHQGKFLHDKFVIFDDKKLLTGSYNWTYSAEFKNHESVIISENDQLIKQFNIIFQNLLKIVKQYDDKLFDNYVNFGAEKAEQEFQKLEKDLEEEFIASANECKRLGIKFNFDFEHTYLKSYGAIGTAKRLLNTGVENIQSGFIKLWEVNRVDITIEGIVTKEKYRILFDERTINNALERLAKFQKSN